jgi:competence ComEA-like helix-hairpin-helix protein
MTPSDTRAFSFAAVLVLGASALRFAVESRRPDGGLAWDSASVLPELLEASRTDVERQRLRSLPLGDDERVDPNIATAETLDRLPGVGPAAAQAIVAAREAGTRFSVGEDLLAVRGIGPATLEKAMPHLTLPARGSGSGVLDSRPEVRTSSTEGRLDLNRASASELETLPGVGAALAARIVETRKRLGRFASVDDLESVRGIGAATVERLRPRVRVGR